MRRAGSRVAHCLVLLGEFWGRFSRHQGFLRASALSFDTALGLIPLLALVFVGLRLAGVQQLVAPMVVQQLAGDSQELGTRILTYIQKVKLGSLGTIGLVGVCVSVLSVLENLRGAFNATWEVTEERSFIHRSFDYLLFIGIVPLLLITALMLTSLFQSQSLVQWMLQQVGNGLLIRLTPLGCSILVMTITYLLLPSVRVKIRPALFGGVIAGTIWQLAHWAYFRFQFGVTRLNGIYGAFSVLPFLLIWIYVSWVLVLAGFELVRWCQEGRPGQLETPDWRSRDRTYY